MATPPPAAPQAPPAGDPAPQRGTALDTVPALQDALNATRAEAAEHRTAARAEKDRAERLELQLRQERIVNALTAASLAAGADTTLLVPYLQGSGALSNINTDDPAKLAEALQSMVTKALEANPKLKGQAPPPPTSGPAPAGAIPLRTFTRKQLQQATPAQLAEWEDDIVKWQQAGSPGIDG